MCVAYHDRPSRFLRVNDSSKWKRWRRMVMIIGKPRYQLAKPLLQGSYQRPRNLEIVSLNKRCPSSHVAANPASVQKDDGKEQLPKVFKPLSPPPPNTHRISKNFMHALCYMIYDTHTTYGPPHACIHGMQL